jgi:hypothetical protein
MARELQTRVIGVVHSIYGGELETENAPEWMLRPGRAECRRRWPLVQTIYAELTGLELPETMPPREHRRLDAVLRKRGRPPLVLEVDEKQHFNRFREQTLRSYPASVKPAYPKRLWIERCQQKTRLEGGGFGKPRPPLFPGEGGRHRQRAFRDALADILPPAHGWQPTLRVADFEVADWIYGDIAKRRMKALLAERLA